MEVASLLRRHLTLPYSTPTDLDPITLSLTSPSPGKFKGLRPHAADLRKIFFHFFCEFFRFGHFRSREGSGWTGFVKLVTNHCLTACGDHSRSASCNICPFLAVRGSTAHPPGRQVHVLNHWAAARRSRPLSRARPSARTRIGLGLVGSGRSASRIFFWPFAGFGSKSTKARPQNFS